MRTRHLLTLLFFLFLYHFTQAQQMKPADPALHARLMKYATDNHLPAGGTYIYWDSVNKKPYRVSQDNFLVEDLAEAPQPAAESSTDPSNALLGGISNFRLISDVNTSTNSGPYANTADLRSVRFVNLNNIVYFQADDGVHGYELWRSDGTAAGTYLVKDISAGEASSYLNNIIVSGNSMFFTLANATVQGYDLWKTDGTAAGTVVVRTFLSSDGFSGAPTDLCDVNGILYFAVSNKNYLNQLWKTDGTTAGTVIIKDFSTSSNVFFLKNFVALDGVLYFVASDATHGAELWRSDGTDAGSYLLKDIDPATSTYTGGPAHLTPYNHLLYFSESNTAASSQKLWISDGTASGTVLANTNNDDIILPVINYYNTSMELPFTINNGVLYISARQYLYYNTTFESDGLYSYNTASPSSGISEVKELGFFPNSNYRAGVYIYQDHIITVNNSIYFSYNDSVHTYLYVTNGTNATTLLLKRFNNYYGINYMANGNGRLYFSATSDSAYYSEPWISDGTEAGTVLLKEIYPGTTGSTPAFFTPLNNKVLFEATDDVHASELWQSDGITTQLLKDINQTTTSSAADYYTPASIPFKSGILTRLYTYDKGTELYSADAGSVSLVKNISAGQTSGGPFHFLVKNGVAYFIAGVPSPDSSNSSGGSYEFGSTFKRYAIYKSDGTEAGTVPITPYTNGSIYDFAVTDNGTVMYAINITGYDYLWKSDGTVAGNTLVYGSPGKFFFNSTFDVNTFTSKVFGVVGNTVYFGAADNGLSFGTELWKSDGTTAGTAVLKDIYAGSGSSYPRYFTTLGSEVFFSAIDGTGAALWKTDGTDAGTIKVNSVSPSSFTLSGNALFFSGYDATYGAELWKTDGTAAGTQRLSDIATGTASANPQYITDVNGVLYFKAVDSAGNYQLWKSDGTTGGTLLVKQIALQLETPDIRNFTSAAGQLYFSVNGKLWLSNGTEAGTGLVADDALGSLVIAGIAANGNQLFLDAYSYKYGYELYTGDATQAALPVTLTSFGASLKGADVLAQWQTGSEVNTSYFKLQRSTDGVHFTDAGKVMAKGVGSTYSFADVNIANLVSAKTIYYRLQTVDKDGSASLSKVIPVNLTLKDAAVLLLPNPVKDVLTIRISNYTGKAGICVFDANGKMVSCSQKTMQSGGDVMLNASALQGGVYLVKISLDGKVIQQKFIKE